MTNAGAVTGEVTLYIHMRIRSGSDDYYYFNEYTHDNSSLNRHLNNCRTEIESPRNKSPIVKENVYFTFARCSIRTTM